MELFRRAGRVQTAERGLEATQLAVADRERLLVADVRMQYGVAAAAVRDVLVADELVAAAQQQWDVVRARVDVGGTPPLERDLLEVDLRRFEAGRLLGTERKRTWVEPRSLLVYAAREWCGIKAKVLAEHLHRDASMISRLHAAYVEKRDRRLELQLQHWLGVKSITHA